MTPTVSVVMPAYNHERFVGAAVKSVLDQTEHDLELVVIDDGSRDQTASIVESFDDKRIRLFRQENQDAYNALNRGIVESRGRFVSILNSDDVYHLDRLSRLLSVQRETGAAFIFTDVTPITDRGDSIDDPNHPWNLWHEGNRSFYFERRDLYRGFLHGNFMVTTSNLFMSREAADVVGGFAPIRYLHDYDYVFRLLSHFENQTRYLDDEKLLSYRLHGSNTLSEAAVVGREQDRELIRKYLLARCPADLHDYLNTGIDRLITLEHELVEARAQWAERDNPAARVDSTVKTRGILSRLLGRRP